MQYKRYTHAANPSDTFILGILFSFVAGMGFWLPVGLAVFGVFVGLDNMAEVDTKNFLITGIVLEVSASACKQFFFISAVMSDVMKFVGGALLLVAMRVLFTSSYSNL